MMRDLSILRQTGFLHLSTLSDWCSYAWVVKSIQRRGVPDGVALHSSKGVFEALTLAVVPFTRQAASSKVLKDGVEHSAERVIGNASYFVVDVDGFNTITVV